MTGNNNLFTKDLILLDYEANSKEEVLKHMTNILEEKGYVKDTFYENLIKREGVYPTGLKANDIEIAIPHTDSIHVKKGAIFFARLKNPVVFKEMGTGENDVNVKLIFMLLINNPKTQVNTLSNLMGIFSQKERLEILNTSNDLDEIYKNLSELINQK